MRAGKEAPCPLSLSIGYVSVPQQAKDLRAAYTMADAALYAAKLSGKSAIRQYDSAMEVQYRSQTGFTPRDVAESLPGIQTNPLSLSRFQLMDDRLDT